MGAVCLFLFALHMFSSKPKFKPGVPYEVQRVYDMLTPKPKELLANAGNRRFINEGEVGVFNHKERRTKRRYLYLFNDVLLVTKKEGKRTYWLKIYISLRSSSIRVEDVPDSATRHKVEFRIYAPKKTIILFTQTEEQKLRWIKEIRTCIEKQREGGNDSQNSASPSASPSFSRDSKPKEAPIQISGDIGKIEIPGLSGGEDEEGNYGDIPEDDSSEGEEERVSEPEMISSVPTSNVNIDLYSDVPLPATPNSTPVQPSMLDDFDSLANRNTPQSGFDPNVAFANSQPLQPTQVGISPSNSILQPIPANSTPSLMDQPIQPMQPQQQQSKYDGFAALKSLDEQQGQQQQQFGAPGGAFVPQMQSPQMFTQMQMPNANPNVFQPNVSIEEQMQRLAMQSPYYQGN